MNEKSEEKNFRPKDDPIDVKYVAVYKMSTKTKLFEKHFDITNQETFENITKKMSRYILKDETVGMNVIKKYPLKKEELICLTYIDYEDNQAIVYVDQNYDQDLAKHICIE